MPSNYAQFNSRSHQALIRVYDGAGNVIETHEHKGDFKEVLSITRLKQKPPQASRAPEASGDQTDPWRKNCQMTFCAFIGQSSRKDIGYAPLALQRCKRNPY